MLAATVILMRGGCGWTSTVRPACPDCLAVDTVLLDWSKYVDQEQRLPLWTAVPAGTVSPLVTIDDVFASLFPC